MNHTIINVGYSSTNYWVISAGRSRLLVDLGLPGTFATLRARLDRMDVPLRDVRYAFATHYHIDHAGCAEDLKLAGVPLLVVDVQVSAIPLMKQWTKPADCYTEISTHDNVVISCDESRAFLEQAGIHGQLVHTPGHSDDSVTLLLDDGSAFTGDLTSPRLAHGVQAEAVADSWERLGRLGAKRVYPGHGPILPMLVDRD